MTVAAKIQDCLTSVQINDTQTIKSIIFLLSTVGIDIKTLFFCDQMWTTRFFKSNNINIVYKKEEKERRTKRKRCQQPAAINEVLL